MASDPHAQIFATEAEADAYWAGVTSGLRVLSGEAHCQDGAAVAPRSAGAAAAAAFEPSARRCRHDGWTPERKVLYLEVLVGGAVVADACRAVGMSVASAYALRNRRAGRAWGMMWDAILIHRARGRLGDETFSRAMNGCVDELVKDGRVVAERRRFDNRLAMAVLARLDRLAERSERGESAEAATLRNLSEDFEEYLDCVEAGGDEAAFVEQRRPAVPEPEPEPEPFIPDELDQLAALTGCCDYRDCDPYAIDVSDLDPDRKGEWDDDQWIRAGRSFYLDWLDMAKEGGILPAGPDCPAAYMRMRAEILEQMDGVRPGGEEPAQPAPPSPAHAPGGPPGNSEWQPSTSSTSAVGKRDPAPRAEGDGEAGEGERDPGGGEG